MNKILRMIFAAVAILTASIANAQVETWQEPIDYTGTGSSNGLIETFSLKMEGKSVLWYTIKDANNFSTSYTVWIQLRKKDDSKDGYSIIEQRHIGCVVDKPLIGTKTTKYYNLSTTSTKDGKYTYYKYTNDDVVTAEDLSDEFKIADATTDYYLNWEFKMDENGSISGKSGSWDGWIEFTEANKQWIMRKSYINMTTLKSKSVRYDIYDDKPLWTATGEGTDVDATPILSNRMNAVDHSSNAIDVYVHRKLTKGSWTTLCLPFAVTVENLKTDDALGTDCIISEFKNVDLKLNRVNFLTIKDDVKSLKAGYPYLVYYNGDSKDYFKAMGVTFDYTKTDRQTELTKLDKRKSEKKNDGYYYAALLEPTAAGAATESLGNGCMVYVASPDASGTQYLKKLKDGGSIKGFRAYLYYPSTGVQSAAKGNRYICIDDFADGGTTGMATVTVDGKAVGGDIYNLQGINMGADASHLKAGIYVRNGKKFVVR